LSEKEKTGEKKKKKNHEGGGKTRGSRENTGVWGKTGGGGSRRNGWGEAQKEAFPSGLPVREMKGKKNQCFTGKKSRNKPTRVGSESRKGKKALREKG